MKITNVTTCKECGGPRPDDNFEYCSSCGEVAAAFSKNTARVYVGTITDEQAASLGLKLVAVYDKDDVCKVHVASDLDAIEVRNALTWGLV